MTKRDTHVRLPDDLVKFLRILGIETGKSMNEVITLILSDYQNKRKNVLTEDGTMIL